ncbi:SGNH/GDSL hydrolase family protein [Piscinibacter koreensis]|uniref:SGNH/GDSL hydrolase family protein n=1 Tax=Piscinibacter koreensis TaxID=2742824 RepID=A0A7Y6NMJ9_9BURK|nr:SGNH/GDSL hydrolase family protein [Schlegelella koreensis]NUZ05876.1 SGNH/GDSL hydrolase family protein [Schlegelella koreensis]
MINRRQWIAAASAALLARPLLARDRRSMHVTTLYTFGDSVLDCGHYNVHGVHPGQLLVRNDDALFPEFRGRDLSSRGPARLAHRAVDGATVDGLERQLAGVKKGAGEVAIVSVGGNDLLRGLAADGGAGMQRFEATYERFLGALPIRPVILASVYDPTFGDDSRNFLGVPAPVARANHRRVNAIIAELAQRHGRLADVHAHFLRGDEGWFTRTIEPSLVGASEVRRVFLDNLAALEPPLARRAP